MVYAGDIGTTIGVGDRATLAVRLHSRSCMTQEAGMDPTRFDRLAIAVGQRTTRRAVLGLLAALGLTGLVREEARAACREPGQRCGGGREPCCSGVCKGRPGKKTCRCPQRLCCQCNALSGPVSCSFVTSPAQCTSRCANLDAIGQIFTPQPGTLTSGCVNNQCNLGPCTQP